jgi:hypothetical protein
MKEPWTRGERLAALALALTVLSVVPQVRQMLKLERDTKNEHANAGASKASELLAPAVATAAQDAPSDALTHTGQGSATANADADRPASRRVSAKVLPASGGESATPPAGDRGTEKVSEGGAKRVETASPHAEPDPVAHRVEEDADIGFFRGRVTVCKFGIAPDQRQGSMYTFDRSPVCLETESKVVRLRLDARVSNEPPVFYQGRQYGLRQLHVGDEVEAEMVGEGDMGAPILARIQLVKKTSK